MNPSSIILNKVYPKSWKGTDKLLTDYYFPEDYTKCLIKNVEVIEHEDGKVVSGTNFNIDVNTEKEWDFQLLGKTIQNGTPTPDTPQEIKTVTGRQVINVDGKNLFNKNNIISGKYIDSSGNLVNDSSNFIGDYIKIDINKKYFISASTGNAKRIAYYNSEKAFISRQLIPTTDGLLVIPTEAKYVRLSCYNVDLDTLQLEQNIMATEYEEYKGNTYEVNLGKNLYYITPQTVNGITLSYSSDGAIVLNGTSTASFTGIRTSVNISGTTTLSVSNDTTQANTYVRTRDTNLALLSNITLNSTSTTPVTKTGTIGALEITIGASGITFNNFKIYVQLEKGSQATSYSPYFEPIELCENDKIYKENDIWYLEKKEDVLANPTITPIENEELINQLNAIQLLEGINNISIDGDLGGELKVHYNYVTYREIEKLVFSGIVKNSADMELNPFKPHFCSLQILDPSTLLSEGSTLDYVLANKTVTEAIIQVINSISNYGFVVGNISILPEYDTTIGAYSTLDKAPFDVLQYLSQISQTRWGTRMIDENHTAIDFFSPELLENKEDIDYNTEYFLKYKIEEMTYDYSTTDYRNKQVITSNEVYGNLEQSQILFSNGYSTTYITEQKIGIIKSITVDGVEKTFATSDEKNLGVQADFYYKKAEAIFESNIIYSIGTNIVIKYIPIVNGREVVLNNTEVKRIKNNIERNGIIARYENRNDVTAGSELQAVAKMYVKYKGLAEVTLNIRSRKDFLKLGEKHYFNAPIEKLQSNYLVKKKKTIILQNGDYCEPIYEYELTNSFDVENDINYFDNQRAKANGNITQGEYIARNIDVETQANIIFDSYRLSEVTLADDNILDAFLDIIL